LKEEIKDLIERYLEIVNSPENQKNRRYWQEVYNWNRDKWRGIPEVKKGIPFTIALNNSLWSQILNVDLRDYYNDPETFLETQLRMFIYHFNHFKDNTYFTNELFIWFGVITELTFFGARIKYYSDREPWLEGNTIKEYEDLDNLEIPDFYNSGLMPRIHKYYEVLQEYADNASGELNVMFPEWVRGPFCVAAHLRGLENILMDIILNPEFVHRLIRFIVDAHKIWNEDRDKFLGIKKNTLKLYDDEVDAPTISPAMYKEFIFPYEKELSDYFGEVTYWHSCGKTDDFMEHIKQLNNLKMFHCGPWTSYRKAAEVFEHNTTLDICLDPQKDVIEADKDQMADKLRDIRNSLEGFDFTVRADAFMPEKNLDFVLGKIHQWNEVALKFLNEEKRLKV